MSGFERLSRAKRLEGNKVDFYEDEIKLPDGKIKHYDYIEHIGAAAIIPVLEDSRILMVKQFRPGANRETLEIPAGCRDYVEEKFLDTAMRELEEETGYQAGKFEHLITVKPMISMCSEIIEVYVAKDLVKTSQNLDEDEFIDVSPYQIEELKKQIFNGRIQDSKTIAAIMSYADRFC